MERGVEPPEGSPFGQRLEVVDRFDGLDLDDSHHLPASVLRNQHDIGKDGRRTRPDGAVLLGAGVDADVETTAKPGLQKADDAVVLELFADRPDEDGAHEIATITWMPCKERPSLARYTSSTSYNDTRDPQTNAQRGRIDAGGNPHHPHCRRRPERHRDVRADASTRGISRGDRPVRRSRPQPGRALSPARHHPRPAHAARRRTAVP